MHSEGLQKVIKGTLEGMWKAFRGLQRASERLLNDINDKKKGVDRQSKTDNSIPRHAQNAQ
jgi:hypothetical protein